MFRTRFVCLLTVLACVLGCAGGALALEVDCDAVYCFKSEDWSAQEQPLAGICITGLPAPATGTLLLGTRVLQPGDILTAEQMAQITFKPMRTEENGVAQVTYLPIFENRVESAATMTIAIRGKEDKAPVAQDLTLETYKNLPNEGRLKVSDPEGQAMTYSVIRQPRRGSVEVREDGSFTYTPKKNKVGVDSFTYTATDPAGKVSREATVTVEILKPTTDARYTDTVGLDCRFEAEWLRSTGLFEGEKLGSSQCFQPDKAVSKGQFLAMVLQLLEQEVQTQSVYTELAQDAPQWLKPYVAAAVRSGLLAGAQLNENGSFEADAPITGGEAALILSNALDLSSNAQPQTPQEIPTWQENALAVLGEHGFDLEAEETLSRGQAAQLLYWASGLCANAPGMAVFRLQQ
jgi:hypothetical protein